MVVFCVFCCCCFFVVVVVFLSFFLLNISKIMTKTFFMDLHQNFTIGRSRSNIGLI